MRESASSQGQSLIEVLVGIGLGAFFIIGAATIIAPALNINTRTTQVQTYAEVQNELINNINAWAGGNWSNVLTTVTSTNYFLNTSSSPFAAVAGGEAITLNNNSYARSFYLTDVYRDSNGNVTTTATGNTYDPSTKQVTVGILGPIQTGNATSASSPYPFAQTPDNAGAANCWIDFQAVGGYLYGLGGNWTGTNCAAPATTTVYYTAARGGSLGSWIKTASIPQASNPNDAETYSAVYNGYIYITIGNIPAAPTTTIYYAKPNSDGSISAWNVAGTSPNPYYKAAIMATNGYLYLVGGNFQTRNLYYAKINSDGTLGSFTTLTNNPVQWQGNIGAAYNGYLYMPDQGVSPNSANIYYAKASSTGAPISWQTTTALPQQVYTVLQAYGGYLYAFQADDAVSPDHAWYAPIHTDGTLGSWTEAVLPSTGGEGYSNNDFAISNGMLYLISVDTTSTVYYAPSTQLASTTFLITRNQNNVFSQTDWSGGSGQNGPFTVATSSYFSASNVVVNASGSLNLFVSSGTYALNGTLDSATFDTQVTSGSQLNSLVWQGNSDNGTGVKFQLAVSNASSGPWNFEGPDGTGSTYFSGNPNTPISLISTINGWNMFANYRYVRYRVTFLSDGGQLFTPTVTQININWSP